jgi:sec-independent protein translocase protein TatC
MDDMEKDKKLSFWGHLAVLRGHLVRMALVLAVLAIVMFCCKDFVFNKVLLPPKSSDFITNRLFCSISQKFNIEGICGQEQNLQIINVNMAGQFTTHIYISIMMALIAGAPYLIWEIWRFVKPALKKNEEKYAGKTLFSASLLFYIGVLFSYFLITPITINFLGTYQVSGEVVNMINLNSYISTIMNLMFAVGLVFELPIIVYFLSKIGIITPAIMKKYRKIMIVIIFFLAAVITPPDVFSQIMVAIPLLLLYEAGIIVSGMVTKKKLPV